MPADLTLFEITSLLLVMTAVLSYVNLKLLRLPTTIGVMLISLLLSLAVAGANAAGYGFAQKQAALVLSSIDFEKTLLDCMLAFLLFAGSLHVRMDDLLAERWSVTFLSTVGVLISTLVVGVLSRWLLAGLGLDIPLIYCLLFGALISPTDPVAVMGILKTANIPRQLETKIAGESLFNDGVGVVFFAMFLSLLKAGTTLKLGDFVFMLTVEAAGGILLGACAGLLAYRMLKGIDNYQVEVMITLALAMGGYAAANRLGVSGPLCVVVAGLFIGNHGRERAMSDESRIQLDSFWDLNDGILNAVLFLLIGLEIQVIQLKAGYLSACMVAIAVSLLARWISVVCAAAAAFRYGGLGQGGIRVMTWSGLRGGISVAMALSLPPGTMRDLILMMTYAVVIFSIVVQGLTLAPLVRSITKPPAKDRI